MSEPATQCRGNVGGGEGGGGGMRTVECLRGRLQAERVASKAAKEEADQLASRLDELEKQLAEEVKIKNKAERRLRRAIKRLESLKILDVQLSPSETSIGSLSSNSTGCSGQQQPEPAGSLTSTIDSVRSVPHAGGGEDKGWDGDSAKGSSAGSCTTQANSSHDGSWFSVVSAQSGSGLCCKEEGRVVVYHDDAKSSGGGSGDGAATDAGHDSQRESEQPAASSGSSKSEASYRGEEDDRLALVLVENPHYHTAESGRPRTEDGAETSDSREPEAESNRLAMVLADPQPQRDAPPVMGINGGSGNDVQSVLLALRQVKEQLRYTIERRSEGLVAHRELYGH
ncbi:uncharacterized protein LOC124698182 [Lolium rigidum]|uniref:uncharacterized protein LOC124698182 n=1 Tax=Lolium rigidum TaxID=89674 RepID=UPI001F5DB0BA|nr:uncharacterized protein LOC124698182 [Lolium rigidum]